MFSYIWQHLHENDVKMMQQAQYQESINQLVENMEWKTMFTKVLVN